MPRIGSLFSGYGGLDLGVQQVLGGSVAWHVEFDEAPSAILEHHWPGVPNYGDVTAVDWTAVEPVDVLTGGFPCQDVSLAGLRRGLKDGTRSGLWSEYARAIDVLRPGLVVIENVRGLLSAEADRAMESSPWGVGDRHDGPALRALGAVLGDLADLGYDAEWGGLRAADAGAPHGRYRVFIAAHPAGESRSIGHRDHVRAGSGTVRHESSAGGGAAPDTAVDLRRHRSVAGRRGFRQSPIGGATPHPDHAADDGERARSRPQVGDGGVTADASSARLGQHPGEPSAKEAGPGSRDIPAGAGRPRPDRDWGPYRPAIERWEHVTGRLAPAPTNPDGRDGAHRLAPEFVEWMMGLPAGHVTSAPITRAQQLKALGNGVVPQQAALAVSVLLERIRREDAA